MKGGEKSHLSGRASGKIRSHGDGNEAPTKELHQPSSACFTLQK